MTFKIVYLAASSLVLINISCAPGELEDYEDNEQIGKSTASSYEPVVNLLIYSLGFLIGYLIVILPFICLFYCYLNRRHFSLHQKVVAMEMMDQNTAHSSAEEPIFDDCHRNSTLVYEDLNIYDKPPPPRPYWPILMGSRSAEILMRNQSISESTASEPDYQLI